MILIRTSCSTVNKLKKILNNFVYSPRLSNHRSLTNYSVTNKSSSLHSETQLQSGVAGEKLKISESNSFQRKIGFYLCGKCMYDLVQECIYIYVHTHVIVYLEGTRSEQEKDEKLYLLFLITNK